MGEKVKRIHELVKLLNEYRDAYYNRAESLVLDSEYSRQRSEPHGDGVFGISGFYHNR